MRIPLSYKKLTLRQFIEIKKVEQACKNKEQVKAALITYFTGRSVASIPLGEWKNLILKVELLLESYDKIKGTKPKNNIWVKGKRFSGITDATKLNNNQFTGVFEFCKNGQSDINLNKIAGLLFCRHKINSKPVFIDAEWEDVAELMLYAKVGDIAPTVFFYAEVLKRLLPLLPGFLLLSQMEIEKGLKEIMAETPGEVLNSIMVGTTR